LSVTGCGCSGTELTLHDMSGFQALAKSVTP
jgi:hypothetical protein